jgi:hypothetical protein
MPASGHARRAGEGPGPGGEPKCPPAAMPGAPGRAPARPGGTGALLLGESPGRGQRPGSGQRRRSSTGRVNICLLRKISRRRGNDQRSPAPKVAQPSCAGCGCGHAVARKAYSIKKAVLAASASASRSRRPPGAAANPPQLPWQVPATSRHATSFASTALSASSQNVGQQRYRGG